MNNLRKYRICGHIHDEVIIEAPKDTNTKAICEQMAQTLPWIPGLSLRAEGFETEWYRKD